MRVLVTGSHGFVGKHVVRELEDDHKLITPKRDELDLIVKRGVGYYHGFPPTHVGFMAWYFCEHKIDAIVHLAATCGGIGINKENPGRFIYENLQMGINTLEAARLAGVPKVVNLGTVCSYPKFTKVPFQEEDIWDGYPEETNAPYGIAKKAIMEMGIAYARQYGMDVTNLIPGNMAGEYDHFDECSSHVIPALIKKFENPQVAIAYGNDFGVLDANVKRSVVLWGTGSASREFLHASDCARAIAIALEKNTGPDPINLGTGQEITIADLAAMIKEVGGYDADIVWDNSKLDGQPRRCLDISRAKSILRWEPRISLKETVRRTIQWYRSNGNI